MIRGRYSFVSLTVTTTVFYFLIAAAAVFFPQRTAAAYIVQVGHEDEHCIIVRTPPRESTIFGSYDVLDDNLSPEPVAFSVFNSDQYRIYKSHFATTEGHFSVRGQGRFTICIQNGMDHDHISHDRLDREVAFEVRVLVDDPAAPLVGLTNHLNENLWNLQARQDYMRTREVAHREVTEETFSELLTWTIVEAVALVVVSFGQVLYFRRFLEKRRYM